MRQLFPTRTSLTDNENVKYVADAPTLIELEGRQILAPWNGAHEERLNVCVHELFEQTVARDPDAVAVVFKDRRLSYRELNARANQVARVLRKRGVSPENLVGICLGRSPEMVIALLGVWKAGGAYVPLDPSYPRERLSFMVKDAGVKVLLTGKEYRDLLSFTSDRTICVDSDVSAIGQEDVSNLSAAANPSNLSYVMYTSGSSGQPKGVMIQHDSLVNYLCWAILAYAVEGGGSLPVHSSIAFDSTVASLYPPLLSGGQIELLPENVGVQSLLDALRTVKNRSKVVITPAHLELLNQQLHDYEVAGMTEVLVVAGENLLAESLSKWRDFAPATRLFNEYGPTETTVGCCAYEVQKRDPRSGSVPIGSPIANAQLHVLDANLHPLPLGVVGELYIGGVGVARGYLNRPALTRERFVDDRFSGRSGARLYKTGDLVRYREDGTLEFRGRVDNQVKVRGYRIELGEIESTLAAHPGVQSCAVLAREDTPGDKQLVGYITTRSGDSVNGERLQRFLKQTLPDYMVPHHFVFLDSFPLTPNGKIDRKVLPAPSYVDLLPSREFVAPRTETEKKLAAMWMRLLKVDRVGIHDDFFNLGGHSLAAVRVLSEIQEEFGVTLSMPTLLGNSSLAGMADALAGSARSSERLAFGVALQTTGKKPAIWLAGGNISMRPLLLQLGADQPFYSMGLTPGCTDQLKAPFRMEELAQHLVTEIRAKQPVGPYFLGGFCRNGVLAYEIARQLMQDQEVGLLFLIEPFYPRQSARRRIAKELRRIMFRVGFRYDELRRQELANFPVYARNRWKGLKLMLADMLWRTSTRFSSMRYQAGSPDLEQILFLAVDSYKPKPLKCPTVIFRCKDWPMLSAGDPFFGWRELLTGPSETREIPGDHVGIFHEPNVRILAQELRACLQNARRVGASARELVLERARNKILKTNEQLKDADIRYKLGPTT